LQAVRQFLHFLETVEVHKNYAKAPENCVYINVESNIYIMMLSAKIILKWI
jgi:hypothetical protein